MIIDNKKMTALNFCAMAKLLEEALPMVGDEEYARSKVADKDYPEGEIPIFDLHERIAALLESIQENQHELP